VYPGTNTRDTFGKVRDPFYEPLDAVSLPDVKCSTEGCDGTVEAWPGTSAGYFTGHREYYSTFSVICVKCGRQGFTAFYQGEEYRETALQEGLRQFMERDSRPKLVITPT
jgi:hypothetical protein